MGQVKKDENPMLEKILEYHRRGWSIIPVRYRDKKPALTSWKPYQETRADEAKIQKWFSEKKNAGVLLGKISGGLCCLDFDDMQGYEQWKEANPDFAAKLPTVQTSRGWHVYFRSTLRKTQKLEKLDIKASGYMILPPSVHPDGKTVYAWKIRPNGEIPELTLSDLGIKNFTEEAEDTEDTEDTEDLIASQSLLSSVSSGSSVSSDSSPSSVSSASSVSSVKSIRREIVIWEELDDTIQHYVNMAIKCSLPSKKGYRNFLIFQFCRWLKGCPEFEEYAAGPLKPLVRLWHTRALSFIGTQGFDETWADFAYGWKKVKYPRGDGVLKTAVGKALDAQNTLIAEELYEKSEIKLLVRICFELQGLQQKESFWLSWNDAALILGVSPPTAGKWLCMLEADGVLQETKEHTHRKATRYQYVGKSGTVSESISTKKM